jgi:hypothetical protein
MLTKSNEKNEKKREKYFCEKCNFICSYKSDFTRHCTTRKHLELTQLTNSLTDKTIEHVTNHICSHCGKEYTSRVGLWKHTKVCKRPEQDICIASPDDYVGNNEPIQNYIMKLVEHNMLLVEQNQDFKQTLVDQSNKIMELAQHQNTTINNNTTNNNKTINTQFNLNVFLQEKCKDALNMSEFLETLQINPQSVEYTGTHGYVNGITKIFMDGLNQLDTYKRPIHCTDLKRETLYIKEEDKWEKDTEEKANFKKALDKVVNRNMAQVRHWEDENPRCKIPETDEYEFYFVIARQSLGGGDHTVTARNNDKIMKAVAGRVYLDKKCKELL